ncbi:hypothetical protein ACRPM7_05140 [Burkholderia vietnamiensis]|nr:hypothetical protein [Burkholderia vietnamiensis]MBR8191560.1 hypothetical protein [Burkholderia vietnamiensis]QTK86112.1 hypothetical protein J4D21_14995 [Burkholderia vietnamiensis]
MKLKSHILAIGAMLATAVAHAAPTLQSSTSTGGKTATRSWQDRPL